MLEVLKRELEYILLTLMSLSIVCVHFTWSTVKTMDLIYECIFSLSCYDEYCHNIEWNTESVFALKANG